MTLAYVDSSVVLRHVLGEPAAYRGLEKFEGLYCSELLRVESLRTLDRARIQYQWSDAETALRISLYHSIETRLSIVDITPDVIARASAAFPTSIRTLNAFHVATFVLLMAQIPGHWTFVTHDQRQADAITALGHRVVG